MNIKSNNNFDFTNKYVFEKYNTPEKRKKQFNKLCENKREFINKIYLVGFGSVGRPLLWVLFKILEINPNNVTIIDERDITEEFKKLFKFNIKTIKTRLSKNNFNELMKDLSYNDLIIDAADELSTIDIMNLCQERGANYISSCIQDWNKFNNYTTNKLYFEQSIFSLHNKINDFNNKIKHKNFNAIVSMGCNPGNVSIWTKFGLLKIADEKKIKIENKDYNVISKEIGLQTLHISEKDTQISSIPKKINEYCNTWSMSIKSYFGEGLSCLEISLGTHEPKIEKNIVYNDNSFIISSKIGIYSYAQSWIPFCNRIIGNLIPHDESNTIGQKLTIKNKNGDIKYKPSVYYVYHACNDAMLSVDELKQNTENYQNNYRCLTNEIIDGRDILGLTYFLEDKSVYWIGSLLSIQEARDLFDNQINEFINATNVQVLSGYISGILYIMDLGNQKLGKLTPDDIPEYIIRYQLPFLGEFIFDKANNFNLTIVENNINTKVDKTNEWTFNNFIIEY